MQAINKARFQSQFNQSFERKQSTITAQLQRKNKQGKTFFDCLVFELSDLAGKKYSESEIKEILGIEL